MDEQLGSVLAVLVARTGAHAARVVDARGGGVLAQVGHVPAADVRALVALARDIVPVADGPEDLVLATGDGVHVLRTFPGVFVHLRVDAGPGVAPARRELASPALREAVEQAVRPAARGLPATRRPESSRHVRQPALAALGAQPGPSERAGALAVLALAREPGGPVAVAARPLSLPAVLKQEWAGDPATMARLLDGLRRLNLDAPTTYAGRSAS